MEYKVYLSTKVNPARLEPGTGIMALEPEDYTVDQIREDLLKKEKLLDEKLEKAKLLKEKLEETQKQLDDLCAMQIIQIRQTEKDHIDLLKIILMSTLNIKARKCSGPSRRSFRSFRPWAAMS